MRCDKNWQRYKNLALTIVDNVLKDISKIESYKFKRVTIRNQRTRWGSCSCKRNLNFNYRIVFLPYEIAKYLVVHEYCHLKHLNHSKEYWDTVRLFIPDYQDHKKKLRSYEVKKLFK